MTLRVSTAAGRLLCVRFLPHQRDLHPFICLIFELIGLHPTEAISAKVRRIMRVRSIATLCLFALAVGVALKYQIAGLGICICCLIVYLRPTHH